MTLKDEEEKQLKETILEYAAFEMPEPLTCKHIKNWLLPLLRL